MSMRTVRKRNQPFTSAAQFFRQTGLHAHFDRLAEDVRIRRAFESAGFRLRKIQREEFRFTIVTAWARRLAEEEARPERLVRRAILIAFRSEGLPLKPKFLVVRFAGRHVGEICPASPTFRAGPPESG
jgi:hypothetical protein